MKASMTVFLFFALNVFNANAQTHEITAYGAGTRQCGQYLLERQKDNNKYDGFVATYFGSYAFGYISGYNSFTSGKQVSTTLATATVIAYIDKYCRDNPLSLVNAAIECLMVNSGGPEFSHCK